MSTVSPKTPSLSLCRDVLNVLLDRDDPHAAMSLHDVCTALAMDQTTGREVLRALEAQDAIVLEAMPGSGDAPENTRTLMARAKVHGPLLTVGRIRNAIGAIGQSAALPATPPQLDLEVYDSADSTNSLAVAAIRRAPDATPILVAAEAQPLGRGRQGRRWHASAWRNLICSMGWRITAGVGDLTGLSLVAGICVADTVADLGVSNIRIKWPNDVLVNSQKLAGILVEAQPLNQSDGQLALVIGIGLNIHVSDRQAAGIEKTWCDLDHLADPPDRNVLIAALHARMQLALRLFLADGFAPFKSRYSRVDELMGKQLALQVGSTVHRGCARGVDDSGRLLLQFPGGVQAFGSGHVISNVAD